MKKSIPATLSILLALLALTCPAFAGSAWTIVDDETTIWTFSAGATGDLEASLAWKQLKNGPFLIVVCSAGELETSAFGLSQAAEKRGPVGLSMGVLAGSSCAVGVSTTGPKVSGIVSVRADGSDPVLRRAKSRHDSPLVELLALQMDAVRQLSD